LASRPAPGRGPTPEPRRARWPLWAGAAGLALGNLATLLLAGHPWSITWGFTLWGANAAAALGRDPASSAIWCDGFPAEALAGPVLADVPSLMDLAIVIGALCAVALLGGGLIGYGPIAEDLAFGHLGLAWTEAIDFADHRDKPFDATGACCEWLGDDGEREVVLTQEPDSSAWIRSGSWLLAPFVPDEQL
jgi:hypothetical protein